MKRETFFLEQLILFKLKSINCTQRIIFKIFRIVSILLKK